MQTADLDAVLDLNQSEVPHVSALDADGLRRLHDQAEVALVATRNDAIVGFVIALPPGVDYASPNYGFFARRGGTFLYIDRVAVASRARRIGVAAALYDAVEAHARETGRREVACEVNLRPPNPGSLAFHLGREYVEVGRQDTSGGSVRVLLLARRLDSDIESAFDEPPPTPTPLLDGWLADARAAPGSDPTAMVLATVDGDGAPDARVVLLRGADEHGVRFYTNRRSPKGRQLAARPVAAAVLYWRELGRQIRLRGPVSMLSDAESDAYFASRPREAQLGAWASVQSEPLHDPGMLAERLDELAARFADVEVPRPDHWGGYLLQPEVVEFWRMGDARLHDRLQYTLGAEGWRWQYLQP